MNILLPLIIVIMSCLRAEANPVCHIADGPIRAEGTFKGKPVIAHDGRITVGNRTFTVCTGLPGAYPTSIAVVKNRLYVGFRAAGLAQFDGQKFELVKSMDPRIAIRALAPWRGRLLIGTSQGLKVLHRSRLIPSRHWILGKRATTALGVDRRGRLHIAAGPYGWWIKRSHRLARRHKSGFYGCFKQRSGRMQAFTPGRNCHLGQTVASGLPSAHVSMLAIHRNTLFVGHFDAGLARQVSPTQFAVLERSPRFINALVSDGRTLWIGTARGLFATDDGRTVYRPAVRLPSDHVNGLALGLDGTVWVATSRGVAGIDGGGVRVIDHHSGLPGRIAYAVAVDFGGHLWVGTERGAVAFTATGTRLFNHIGGQLPHDWVTAILPDGECVYIGTYDAGITRACVDNTSDFIESLGALWVNPHGLFTHEDHVFISTLGTGLVIRNQDGIRHFTQLPSLDVTGILVFGDDAWIATRGGLVSMPVRSLLDGSTSQIAVR